MRLLRLTGYEIKKAACKASFAAALLLLLAANLFFSCDRWQVFGTGRAIAGETHRMCAMLDALTPEEDIALEAALLRAYGADTLEALFFAPLPEMFAVPGHFGQPFSDLELVSDLCQLRRLNEQCASAFETVLAAARTFGAQALQAGDDYEVRRNLAILRLYAAPRAEICDLVSGWEEFLFGWHPMLLALLLILPLCAGSFTGEAEQQTLPLLQTSKNGKGLTTAAKLLAAALLAAGITLLFEGASLLVIGLDRGLWGGCQPVCAIEALRLCPYRFMVWQFALIMLACRVFSAVAAALLLCAVSAVSRSGIVSFAAGGLLLLAGLWLPAEAPKAWFWGGPLALARPERYFASYATANLFGWPVLQAAAQAVLWGVITAGAAMAGGAVYHRRRRVL